MFEQGKNNYENVNETARERAQTKFFSLSSSIRSYRTCTRICSINPHTPGKSLKLLFRHMTTVVGEALTNGSGQNALVHGLFDAQYRSTFLAVTACPHCVPFVCGGSGKLLPSNLLWVGRDKKLFFFQISSISSYLMSSMQLFW